MALENSLYDLDEQVTAGHKGGREEKHKFNDTCLKNDQPDLGAPVKEKKLSRIERHKSEIVDFDCDWGKFPEVVKSWGRRRDRYQRPSNDFDLFAVKMAIVDEKYPDVLIKEEMVWPLQSAIFSMLNETPRPYAKIGISNVIDGALRINCFGSKAVDWLKGLEGLIVEDITFKVLQANELPKMCKNKHMPNGFECSSNIYSEQAKHTHTKTFRDQQFKRNAAYNTRSIKMAIVSDNYLHVPIEQHMVSEIQKIINEMLDLTNNPKPSIYVSKLVCGALCIVCEGTDSVNWLKGIEGKSVKGITLKVMNIEDLPKPIKMSWTTKKHLTDTPKMLEYLQRWNRKLQTNYWQIVYTSISGYYLRRLILMDAVSANVIKAANYNLYAGVEFTRFRLHENEGNNLSASGESIPLDRCYWKVFGYYTCVSKTL